MWLVCFTCCRCRLAKANDIAGATTARESIGSPTCAGISPKRCHEPNPITTQTTTESCGRAARCTQSGTGCGSPDCPSQVCQVPRLFGAPCLTKRMDCLNPDASANLNSCSLCKNHLELDATVVRGCCHLSLVRKCYLSHDEPGG